MEKLGIENLKKVVTLLAVLANTGDAFGATKGVDRWNQLLGLGEAIRVLPGFDFRKVMPEIKDLDAAEREELRKLFDAKLDLKDSNLENMVEKGLGIAERLMGVIEDTKLLVAEFKHKDAAPESAPVQG